MHPKPKCSASQRGCSEAQAGFKGSNGPLGATMRGGSRANQGPRGKHTYIYTYVLLVLVIFLLVTLLFVFIRMH